MGARIVKRCRGPVLWVAHRRELLQQAVEHLTAAGCEASLYTPRVVAPVEVASALSALRSKRRYATIIIDECHRAASDTYVQMLKNSPGAAVIGLTATPWRLDDKPLRGVFSSMVTAATVPELIEAGYVAAPITFGVSQERARELISGVAASVKDYNLKELSASMERPPILGDVVAERERLGGDSKTLVFAVSSTHAEKLVKRFRAKGRTAEVLGHHVRKRKRDAILQRFRHGDLQIVVNVDLLAEGFDMAAIQCVSMARPTRSLTRYLQYVGRALRPYGSEAPVVLDHVGNVWRHGLPEAHRDWTLEDRKPEYTPPCMSAPVWQCGSCGQMLSMGAQQCPRCGFDAAAARMKEDRRLQLERVSSPMPECVVCGNPCKTRMKHGKPTKHCSLKCSRSLQRRVEKTCPVCGKSFPSYASSNQVFCTRRCYWKGKKKTPTNTAACKTCGKQPLKGQQQYCNLKCRNASYVGRLRYPPKLCLLCGNPVSRKSKATRYCSRKCAGAARSKK